MKFEKKILLEFEKPLLELSEKLEKLKELAASGKMDMSEEIKMMEKRIELMRRDIFSKLTPLQIVQVARHLLRPTTLDYIQHLFENFVELHGDRYFADDPSLVGGFAKLNGRSVAVIGHQKGKTT